MSGSLVLEWKEEEVWSRRRVFQVEEQQVPDP